jgi:hypothetical protein
MKIQIKSVLEEIAPQIFQIKNLNEAKDVIKGFLESKKINDIDKQIIFQNINNSKNISSIHRYIANSLLKYEGMGVK